MKDLTLIPPLLTLVLIAASAAGQNTDMTATNDLLVRSEINAARGLYTETEGIVPAADNGKGLAQLPRRGPGMPLPRQRGYYRGNYPTPWMGSGDPGHALIGAGIGFGIGATIGAVSGARTGMSGQRAIIGGALFGFVGAAIGSGLGGLHPVIYRRRSYRPSWSQEDEEGTRRSHSKRTEDHAELSIQKRPIGHGPADDAPNATAPPN